MQIAIVFAEIDCDAVVANFETGPVAVDFGDVELPAGWHTVVAQAFFEFGMIPIEIGGAKFKLAEDGHAGGFREGVAAGHDSGVGTQIHFVVGVLGVAEVAAGAGLRALEP